jgi:hypothetical protein
MCKINPVTGAPKSYTAAPPICTDVHRAAHIYTWHNPGSRYRHGIRQNPSYTARALQNRKCPAQGQEGCQVKCLQTLRQLFLINAGQNCKPSLVVVASNLHNSKVGKIMAYALLTFGAPALGILFAVYWHRSLHTLVMCKECANCGKRFHFRGAFDQFVGAWFCTSCNQQGDVAQ